jgi:cystathionine gamma-synthase
MLFPSSTVACRCVDFLHTQNPKIKRQSRRIFKLLPKEDAFRNKLKDSVAPEMAGVFFPSQDAASAKTFWQHTGDGTSSRRAEFCYQAFQDGLTRIELEQPEANVKSKFCKGPRRYQKRVTTDQEKTAPDQRTHPLPESFQIGIEGKEQLQFVEERFGRNLNVAFVKSAKIAIRRRIAGSLTADVDLPEAIHIPNNEQTARKVKGFSEDDAYLYPAGMSAIFNAHRMLMAARGPMKSICFG